MKWFLLLNQHCSHVWTPICTLGTISLHRFFLKCLTLVLKLGASGSKDNCASSVLCPSLSYQPMPCEDDKWQTWVQIAMWSLKKAQRRLQSAKRKRENPDEDELAELRDAESAMGRVAAQASEVGDNRPLTACQFSPDGLQLATASIAGTVKIWDVPDLNKTLTIGAHDTRVTGSSLWMASPIKGRDLSDRQLCLACQVFRSGHECCSIGIW